MGLGFGYPNPHNFLARYAKLVNEDFLIFRFVYINAYIYYGSFHFSKNIKSHIFLNYE